MNRILARVTISSLLTLLLPIGTVSAEPSGQVSGELRKWHRVTLSFAGPETAETADPNPFRDFRLSVEFTHVATGRSHVVPGFFAADGDAAETGATSGAVWRVHFSPDAEGAWRYRASFRTGTDVAASLAPEAGRPSGFDGATGEFTIAPSDKSGQDFRGHGRLNYVGEHYLRFADSQQWFLKGGADSPENLLGFVDFDDTYRVVTRTEGGTPLPGGGAGLHRFTPHRADWNPGDPTWQGEKGRGLIGALNYLASKGMNSVYFLTMNVGGDGQDVWPWTQPDVHDRFDCSKLDQWEIVFSHMTARGLMLHMVLQEQENDQLLNEGDLGLERRLYFRELVARFGHHPAVVFNLGEENTNSTEQQRQFCEFLKAVDPDDHPIVVHTFPNKIEEVYRPLLGFPALDGPSLQTNDTYRQTLKWREASARSGHKWFVCLDEIGPAHTGVKPDADDPEHREVVQQHLWGNLLAGGSGCEWLFGYKWAHNDLNCEDWRSRDRLWDVTRHALTFFQEHLPFTEMQPADHLTSDEEAHCFAMEGWVYALFVPEGTEPALKLPAGTFRVQWYDPQQGGDLQEGSAAHVEGGGAVTLGAPPTSAGDWVALVRNQR